MGLKELISNKKKTALLHGIIVGEGRTLKRPMLEDTGLYLLHHDYTLGYNSFPETITSYRVGLKGKALFKWPVALLYEPMARPFDFSTMDWKDKKQMHKKDVLLDAAMAEGHARAEQSEDREQRFGRLQTVTILVSGMFAILLLLYVFQSGALSNLFGG